MSSSPSNGLNNTVPQAFNPLKITDPTDPAFSPARKPGTRSVETLTTEPLGKVRVAIIGLGRGISLLKGTLAGEDNEVTVVCDMREDRCQKAVDIIKEHGQNEPVIIQGDEIAWEAILKRDDVDVIVIATPWEGHVPMALATMKAGKHAMLEVSAAVSVQECWELVDTSEQTQRHCIICENCCYGESEMLVLNMVSQGVFGEITHGEAAYIHDLRSMLFKLQSEGDWRREYHKIYNGNLYPTHGLGPIAQYMGINRGDQFKYLVSMSSPEKGLTKYRNANEPNDGRHAGEIYVTGDMNTSIIKTERGRTIMLQHDIISPRPYSRINMLTGTEATFMGYPNRLALDHPEKHGITREEEPTLDGHGWLPEKDFEKMKAAFKHPLIKRLEAKAKDGGHGGMDTVMMIRHLECIKNGETPDSTVYDAAAWTSILQLSTQSVSNGSAPVCIPDFTRGGYKNLKPL